MHRIRRLSVRAGKGLGSKASASVPMLPSLGFEAGRWNEAVDRWLQRCALQSLPIRASHGLSGCVLVAVKPKATS